MEELFGRGFRRRTICHFCGRKTIRREVFRTPSNILLLTNFAKCSILDVLQGSEYGVNLRCIYATFLFRFSLSRFLWNYFLYLLMLGIHPNSPHKNTVYMNTCLVFLPLIIWRVMQFLSMFFENYYLWKHFSIPRKAYRGVHTQRGKEKERKRERGIGREREENENKFRNTT